jgi:acetolactate decarboxylase
MPLKKIAKENGIDITKAFPFRIIGNFERVDFHIISKPKKEKVHNHELHDKAKKRFSLTNTSGELLGFYSQNHIGVFTHKGHFIHTHFIDNQKKNMGHLDDIKITQKITVLLPIQ